MTTYEYPMHLFVACSLARPRLLLSLLLLWRPQRPPGWCSQDHQQRITARLGRADPEAPSCGVFPGVVHLQGYLINKKTHQPRTLSQAYG